MTFAFPRDFTHGQHKNFVKHLARRRAGVKVDWWGATKLTAVMTGSEAGCAIANRFFHSEGPVELVDRATRVGGSLRTPPDLLEREAAIGDFLRTTGPHFDFHTTNRPKSDEEVPLTPNAALRLEFGPRRSASCIVDAVPRTAAPLEHYGPKGSMPFNDRKRGGSAAQRDPGSRAGVRRSARRRSASSASRRRSTRSCPSSSRPSGASRLRPLFAASKAPDHACGQGSWLFSCIILGIEQQLMGRQNYPLSRRVTPVVGRLDRLQTQSRFGPVA